MKLSTAQAMETEAVITAITTSGKALSATQSKMKTQGTTAFTRTLLPFANKDIEIVAGTKSESVMDEYKQYLVENLSQEALASIGQDKEGNYKFRSSDLTKNAVKYCSSIGRAVESGATYEDVFEHADLKGMLPSKKHVESFIEKDSFAGFKQAMKTAEACREKITDPTQIREMQALVSGLMGQVAGM